MNKIMNLDGILASEEREKLYATNFFNISSNNIETVCKKVEKQLNTERLLKFRSNVIINNTKFTLAKLVYLFFIAGVETVYADIRINKNLFNQTEEKKRRSIIDFYLLQRFYFKNPMSFYQCYLVYINIPGRSIDKKCYYCTTVKRNVFLLDINQKNNLKATKKIFFKNYSKISANYSLAKVIAQTFHKDKIEKEGLENKLIRKLFKLAKAEQLYLKVYPIGKRIKLSKKDSFSLIKSKGFVKIIFSNYTGYPVKNFQFRDTFTPYSFVEFEDKNGKKIV